MIKFILRVFFNFLFFKAFNLFFRRTFFFIHSDFSFFFVLFIFFLIILFFCLYSLCFYILIKIMKIFEPILNFLSLFKINLRIWLMNHFSIFFLNFLFFFHRIRFVFFFGTSYFDPLLKVLMDRISILKGELLMDFYNFSNKFIFEESFNIPISIFSYTPFFEPSKNFYHVKILYNLQNNLLQIQNRSRTFFYFYFKKQIFSKNVSVFRQNNLNSSFLILQKSPANFFFSNFVKFFLSVVFFFFNFFSFDFFIFLNRLNLLILENSSFSFLKIFFLKYFSYLRNCFIFLLINLEHDSFLNYIQVFLYKLSLRQYFSKTEWNNLFNTYDLQFTSSYPFQGIKKFDIFLFLKITYFYFFIYLNYCFFFIFCILFVCFKFIFFCFYYFFYSANFYSNFFFLIVSDFCFYFFFSHFASFFIFFKKLIFDPCYIFFSNFFKFFNFINFDFFYYFGFFLYLFLLNSFYFIKLIISFVLLAFNKNFLIVHLLHKKLTSFDIVRFLYSSFLSRNYLFYSNIIDILNYFNLKIFFSNSKYLFAINKYFEEYLFHFRFIQLIYLNFYFFSKHFDYFYYYPKFFKFFLFTKLLRSYFFSYILVLPILFSSKKNSLYSSYHNLFNRNFFFIDYFFDVFLILLLSPFFFFLNFLKLFILRFVFYFSKIFSEFLFLFRFFGWSLFLLFHYLFFHFELFFIFFFYFFIIYCSFILFPFFLLFLIYCFCFFFSFYLLSLFFFYFINSNKFYVYFYLLLKTNLFYYFYYYKLITFLKYRNFGFFEVLGIFFLIRNEFKKYEFIHNSLSFINFNSLNTDFLLNNFLNKLSTKNFKNNLYNTKFSFFINTLNFKSKFLSFDNSFSNFKIRDLRRSFSKIKIKSDIIPEFEYHKYLRLRDSRNFNLFRFRKTVDPKDIYFDSALDDIAFFKANDSSNNFLNFDFMKSFYNDDFAFNKEMRFFRNTFSRKNLSFFYDDLDSLSNFRINFYKIAPIFRYFYLKREKMKYLFSMYTFGNINYFSFSILFNWILFYRVLRVTKNLFFSFNNSFLVFNDRQFPKIALFNISSFLDSLILRLNIFLNLIFYIIGLLFFIFIFPFSVFTLIIIFFFVLKILFFNQLFVKFNSYFIFVQRRPFFFHYAFLFYSFFNRFCFLISHISIFKKFSFLKRFYLNLLVSYVYSLFFFFCLLKFSILNLGIICFNFPSILFFFEDNLFIFYFFNSINSELIFLSFSLFEIIFLIFLYFLFILLTRFLIFKVFSSKFYFFDKVLFIKFFLILKNLNILKSHNSIKFSLISPYLLLNELDSLIKISKLENNYIKNQYLK